MKNFKPIKISNPARIDLKKIAEYTLKEWGKLQKKTYLGLFKKSFISLSQSQAVNKITPLIKNREGINTGLLSFCVKKHVVYFRETEHDFTIIRILHSSMDPEKHLL